MADRQDIDGLLMGAVYGELDATDRARLDAHLSSHPEDKAELEALQRTRAQVRRGIAELPESEPSPSISALLLKAAAGEARPVAVAAAVREDDDGGLWPRFVAWLVPATRHPAFAAMAVLVLVAGTATAYWLKNGGKVAEPEVTISRKQEAAAPVATSTGAASGSGSAAGSAVASNAYRVDLADDELDKNDLAREEKAVPQHAAASGEGKSIGMAKPTTTATKAPAPKGGARHSDPGYMQVQPGDGDALDIKTEENAADDGVATGAAATRTAQPPPPPSATEPRVAAQEDVTWAKDQHNRLVKLVAEGKCPEAGRLGSEIKSKAPEYYAQYVANDRNVQQCKQYILDQNKKKSAKDAKSRAQNNSIDQDSPAAN